MTTKDKRLLRMPIGISDFAEIIQATDASGRHYEYVDKTLFIRDLIDEASKVCLLLRPRRFGKTLNLITLQYFFAARVYGKDTQHLFDGLNISRAGEAYMNHQGRYPVIFLSLKDIKTASMAETLELFKSQVQGLFRQHNILESSPKIAESDRAFITKMLSGEMSVSDCQRGIRQLSECCAQHYGENVWLLIDEYDTPVHAAYEHGYYEELMTFMRGFLGSALKDNPYLQKAVMTGILRVSKESLFSDLNNVRIYSSLQSQYGQYFGFTEDEVNALLTKADLMHLFKSVKEWYNGYQMGEHVMYNPWSIINCLADSGALQPYWVNTSSNALIRELIAKSRTSVKRDFELLIQGQTIEKQLDENLVFGDLQRDETALWSFLFLAGYLKINRFTGGIYGKIYEVSIPNFEVNQLYRKMIGQWLADSNGIDWYVRFLKDWLSGDMEHFERRLTTLMLQTFSSFDVESRNPEKFYHGFLLGLTAALMETYQIKSNRESGYGRYDIALFPNDHSKLGVVIECKVGSSDNESTLKNLAELALKQIEEKAYLTEFTQVGITQVLKIGIGFAGKQLKIAFSS